MGQFRAEGYTTLLSNTKTEVSLLKEEEGRPQRVYAGIHLDNICHNVQQYIDRVGPNVKTMAVVKTDAYGHGAILVAKALAQIGVDAFAVATVEEGLELREYNVMEPILILGHVFPDGYEMGLKHMLSFAVFSYENALALSRKADELDLTAHIHLKVDTGMGRIGFLPGEAGSKQRRASIKEIKKIFALPHLKVDGIFTHFAKADWADKTFMHEQEALFKSFVGDLEAEGLNCGIRHMCNSAAAMEKDDDFYDMVRIGITAYGLHPSEEVDLNKLDLRPGMSLVSHIAHVKTVGPGFPVGYGSTYVTKNDATVIATVPVGYGDGYPRSLSNKGFVLVHGVRAPIIGRVCMDQFMVDVTGIGNVKQGDQVVLLGTQVSTDGPLRDTITMEELADLSGRFNYEFACDINKRVPRIYLGNE